MDLEFAESFLRKIVDRAIEYGFEEAQAAYSADASMAVEILMGEVSSFENSSGRGISFKGKLYGQMGRSHTTEFTDEAIEFLISSAADNCKVLDDEDPDFIYCDPENSELIYCPVNEAYEKNTYNRFVELGLSLEKNLLSYSDKIKAVDYLRISCSKGPDLMVNSKGLRVFKDSDIISIIAGCRAESGDVVKSGSELWYGNDIDLFDEKSFIERLASRLLPKLEARSVKSGSYETIIENEAFISLYGSFISNFSAYAMQKGLSLLKGRVGDKIASDCFTLSEIPMYEKAVNKVPFDAEGVLTYDKDIISEGVFKTALYNLKSAYKDGCKSTGNGFGGTSVTNAVVKEGKRSVDEIAEEIGEGLLITDLSGLHAGLNPISGDFSLLSEGFLIKDGKVADSVEQITIAGNFYDIMLNVKETANDTRALPWANGEFFSPSVWIGKIDVSGED
jgi:PmbA protein